MQQAPDKTAFSKRTIGGPARRRPTASQAPDRLPRAARQDATRPTAPAGRQCRSPRPRPDPWVAGAREPTSPGQSPRRRKTNGLRTPTRPLERRSKALIPRTLRPRRRRGTGEPPQILRRRDFGTDDPPFKASHSPFEANRPSRKASRSPQKAGTQDSGRTAQTSAWLIRLERRAAAAERRLPQIRGGRRTPRGERSTIRRGRRPPGGPSPRY